MIARFILGFALFTVCFVGLIQTLGIVMTIDQIVILMAQLVLFLSFSALCAEVINWIEKSIDRMRKRD